ATVAASMSPAPRPARAWLLVGAGLAAAAVTLVLALPDPMAEPVRAALVPSADLQSLSPSPEVALAYQGAGQLEGTRQAPRIQWESGTVHVEVEPDQGIQLSLVTREAEVQVVGTAFSVTRDALGSRVEVDHGRVRVTCVGGDATPAGRRPDRHLPAHQRGRHAHPRPHPARPGRRARAGPGHGGRGPGALPRPGRAAR
ncbi:MAG: FecR domain-containing protein, partial [Pseudomonadota bacterium]